MPVETEFYELLNVAPNASMDEIKASYKKLMLKYHPDKNRNNPGAEETFKRIREAYDVLSNEDKREAYDRYGKEGKNSRGLDDQRPQKKTENISKQLRVSLGDLYNGKSFKVEVPKYVLCSKCTGSGKKPGAKGSKCASCAGQGRKVALRQFGPFVQQMVVECPQCDGKGDTISPADRCGVCFGEPVLGSQEFTVHVDKGMLHSQRITFSRDSHVVPGSEPGDVIFTLVQDKHDKFTRKGDDLHMKHTISLVEALGGFAFLLNHMDNRPLLVKSERGIVVKPGDIKRVLSEGMPRYKDPLNKGSLWVEFDVEMPLLRGLNEHQEHTLRSILPGTRPAPMVDDDTEETELKKPNLIPDLKKFGSGKAAKREDEDEDEEDNMRRRFFGGGFHPFGHQEEEEQEEESYGAGYDDDEDEDPRGHFHRGGGGGGGGVNCAQQ